jgi:aspartate carbamoyltransferase catalytic subunit
MSGETTPLGARRSADVQVANGPAIPAATRLRGKDLLGIAELSPAEISLVLDTAEAMKEIAARPIKKVPALRGKTVVNLFFEPSTRTRTSFEVAEKRLSADTLNIAASTSSVVKGETLADTALNLEAMSPDLMVVRHASSGACHFLSRICKAGIINAGDGMHEHPTQALLDARTILDHRPSLEGLRVAIIGDIAHSRVARSNIYLLSKFGVDIVLCGPASLVPPELKEMAPGVSLTHDIRDAIRDADVIMMLRVQLERQHEAAFPSGEYFQFYGLRLDHLGLARPDAIVMHPGPINRGRELSSEVADSQRSVILNQVENGIAVRMAVLERVIG